MRTIAVINQKGGVGKTTTAVNLSAALARQGKKVCIIDLDPQAHASLHLGVTVGSSEKSVYSVLTEETPLSEVRLQVGENLWLVPAHIDLAAAEMELSGEVGREIILRDQMQEDLSRPDTPAFDFVIMDCPPSLGVLTLNALTTAREVFLPLQPHFLALHGLSKLLRTIQMVARRLNKHLRLTGVVLCMYESGTRLAAEVSSDVEEFFTAQKTPDSVWSEARCFTTTIRRNVRLAEAPSFGQSIFEYSPSSNGAEDYARLAVELVESDPAAAKSPVATAAAVVRAA